MVELLSRTLSQTIPVGGATGPSVKNDGGKLEVVDAAATGTVTSTAQLPHVAVIQSVGPQGAHQLSARAPREREWPWDGVPGPAFDVVGLLGCPSNRRRGHRGRRGGRKVADQPSRVTTTAILGIKRRVAGARSSRPPGSGRPAASRAARGGCRGVRTAKSGRPGRPRLASGPSGPRPAEWPIASVIG